MPNVPTANQMRRDLNCRLEIAERTKSRKASTCKKPKMPSGSQLYHITSTRRTSGGGVTYRERAYARWCGLEGNRQKESACWLTSLAHTTLCRRRIAGCCTFPCR